MLIDRTRGSGQSVKYRRFHLNIRKDIGYIQMLLGHKQVVWTRWPPRVPSNLTILWFYDGYSRCYSLIKDSKTQTEGIAQYCSKIQPSTYYMNAAFLSVLLQLIRTHALSISPSLHTHITPKHSSIKPPGHVTVFRLLRNFKCSSRAYYFRVHFCQICCSVKAVAQSPHNCTNLNNP